ncbi:MAG TPA: phosphorylated adapter RNA export RNA-binding domain-containing protein, partial [Caldilineaceae bacterium]|nr:phosphorylated adapter RNA export RNA-binding domain-containing protein [Caldilineaceae bacterium]
MTETLVGQIAATLNEPNVELLEKVVEVIGPERAADLLQKTIETEAAGGLMVKKGDRRRTPGGGFFQLVRTNTSAEERRTI